MRHATIVSTAIGDLLVIAEHEAIVRITWADPGAKQTPMNAEHPLLAKAERQLTAYGTGDLKTFDLPVAAGGSPHQQAVWHQMTLIPYGETWTYGELAARIGSNARAVGQACGANPVPIVVPCHRVMGQSGRLTGFSGGRGVETKALLLDLERRHKPRDDSDLPLFAAQ